MMHVTRFMVHDYDAITLFVARQFLCHTSFMATSRRYYRLQYRFIAFFILVALPPLVFLGLVATWSVEKTRSANVTELETQLLQSVGERIERVILDRVDGLELRIPDRTITSITQIPETSLTLYLEQLLRLEEFSGLQRVAILDAKGNVIRTLDRGGASSAESVGDSALFTAATQYGYAFGTIRFHEKVPMMTMAARVMNGDNLFLGVIAGDMDLSFIQKEILDEVTLGSTGYVYALDPNGKIIGHSHERRRIGTSTDVRTSVPVRRASTSIDEVRMTLVAEWPEDDAFAVVTTIEWQIALFVLSTFGLILFASIFLARQVTKPISVLRSGADTIGGGNFDHRIDLKRNDELQALAGSLNTMAMRLKELDALKAQQIRTAALAEALQKEQELSHNKDTFISVMSHQLRTPLTTLQWAMELLMTDAKKPALAPYAASIHDAAQSSKQMNAIADDILTVAELGIGYWVRESEAVDLGALLAETQTTLNPSCAEKGVSCTVTQPASPLLVQGSKWNLQKVFQNLLDNAVTYTKQGGMKVTLADGGDTVVITITDTGIGIPRLEQKDVFRAFFRASNAIVGKNVGTGLGLFLVKTIVEGHRGTVTFTSEENRGTTFVVTLPKKQMVSNNK